MPGNAARSEGLKKDPHLFDKVPPLDRMRIAVTQFPKDSALHPLLEGLGNPLGCLDYFVTMVLAR